LFAPKAKFGFYYNEDKIPKKPIPLPLSKSPSKKAEKCRKRG
jgi:hypothetical protein